MSFTFAKDEHDVCLDRGFNVAVHTIANRLFPTGFDVSDNAPETLTDLKAHVRRTGRIVVARKGSDRTIFGDPETNFAFRAWHDHCHLRDANGRFNLSAPGHEFDQVGEFETFQEQWKDLTKQYGSPKARWIDILHAEIMGQFAYHEIHGEFPHDQRAFVEAYLTYRSAALFERW